MPKGYPTDLRTLADHLKKRRLDLGLTGQQVADQLQACEAAWWNWETGTAVPKPQFHGRIIHFLGYDPFPKTPGLRGLRRLLGLTQRQTAAELGVTPTTISRWERGRNPVPARVLDRLRELAEPQAPGGSDERSVRRAVTPPASTATAAHPAPCPSQGHPRSG